MTFHFKDAEAKSRAKIDQLTDQSIKVLTSLWKETFEEDLCQDHIMKLADHVKIFFDEVVDETRKRQEKIKLDIKKLHGEAANLKRLLHVDVNLNPPDNTPLYTLHNILDENLQDLRKKLKFRRDQIYNLLVEQENLCDELDEEPKELLDDPLPTEEMLMDFRRYLDKLQSEKTTRTKKIEELRSAIKQLSKVLEMPMVSEKDESLLHDPCLPLTNKNINRLIALRDNLQHQADEIKETIDNIRKKLSVLWDVLEVSPTVKNKFLRYTGYNQTIYDKLTCELDRCETERRHNIKRFVDKSRKEIEYWWEKTLRSDLERSRFSNFTSDCYTEDLLTLHEIELEDLKKFYYNNEKIFDLIKERKLLWERMDALEDKASEPNRYNNRGGQLLKEEKERKMISKKLPEIESELIKLVEEYEQRNSKMFTIFGTPVQELIKEAWQEKNEKKEEGKSARKFKGQQQTTPFKTPLQKPNSTVKKFGSVSNLPGLSSSKRKLLTSGGVSVKRSLLSELVSPNVQSTSRIGRTPTRLAVIPMIKRRSGRLSASKSKERRISRGRVTKHRAAIDSSGTSESMSYDFFKEYLGTRSPCRSSIAPNAKENKKLKRIATPRVLRINNRIDPVIKSPALNRTNSVSPGKQCKKFTTKNIPILF